MVTTVNIGTPEIIAVIILKFVQGGFEKTCFCHMRTTKVQISLHIRAV